MAVGRFGGEDGKGEEEEATEDYGEKGEVVWDAELLLPFCSEVLAIGVESRMTGWHERCTWWVEPVLNRAGKTAGCAIFKRSETAVAAELI